MASLPLHLETWTLPCSGLQPHRQRGREPPSGDRSRQVPDTGEAGVEPSGAPESLSMCFVPSSQEPLGTSLQPPLEAVPNLSFPFSSRRGKNIEGLRIKKQPSCVVISELRKHQSVSWQEERLQSNLPASLLPSGPPHARSSVGKSCTWKTHSGLHQ